jgi:Domain of unknown function (DUF4192)
MRNRRVARSISTERFRLTPPDPPLRLRDSVDLLAAVPFLLGYHPADSIVVVGLHDQMQRMTVRYDLPPPGADVADHLGARAGDPVVVLRRSGVSAVLLIGYGEPGNVAESMRWLHRAYRLGGLDVIEALQTYAGRYRSVLCADTDCCPVEGRSFEPRDTRVAAECTVAGWVALPDREAYEAQLRPIGGTARHAMRAAATLADERLYALLTHPPREGTVERLVLTEGRTAVIGAEERYLGGGRLDDEEVAWLAILLRAIAVRDVAWSRISGGRERLQVLRALWLDVVRRCQPELSVPPLCLFAFATWRCGDGALARLALETAIDLDPRYTLATEVLYPMVASGMPPSTMRGFPWALFRPRPGSRPRRRSASRRAESRPE